VESYLAAARDAYAPVRRFLCPSDFLLRKLAARGIAPERLVHLPLFVDPARFGEGAEQGPGAYAIFVGRLSAEKGLGTLLAAAKTAREVPLLIAGDGPLAPALARAVREPGLEHVTLAGRLTGEALVERWRAARFTLVPSEWYENFPLAIAESFALGKPVIGTRLGGVAELIGADEARGRLVPPRDPAALAAAMRALWAAPDEARALGRAARAEVTRRFTPQAHWAGLRRAYAAAGAPIGAGGP
jgi:glycosyltransferase involved in cell wall biosynthesis